MDVEVGFCDCPDFGFGHFGRNFILDREMEEGQEILCPG